MSEITAILKCYAPESGGVVAQIVLRDDGSVEIHGDESIAKDRLQQFHRGAAALAAITPPPKPHKSGLLNIAPRRGRPRKHVATYVGPPLFAS